MNRGFYDLIRLLALLKAISNDDFIEAQVMCPIEGDWYDHFDVRKTVICRDPSTKWEEL